MAEDLKNVLNKQRNEYLGGVEESTDKARVLYSPEPLPNEVKTVRRVKNVLMAVFIVSLLCSAAAGEVLVFSALAFIAFAIAASIDDLKVKMKVKSLRSMKFKGSPQMSNSNLFTAMQPCLSGLNASMDTADNGCPSIEYKGFKYDIILNDDETFCLWWRTKSIVSGKNILGRYASYKIHIVSMSVLAYQVQSVYGINAVRNQGAFANQK